MGMTMTQKILAAHAGLKSVKAGDLIEADLDLVRKLYREAQWFFDFCYVENSEGAHNSELSAHCLEVSELRIDEAMALLN